MIFIFWEDFEKRYNIITGNSSTNTTNPRLFTPLKIESTTKSIQPLIGSYVKILAILANLARKRARVFPCRFIFFA